MSLKHQCRFVVVLVVFFASTLLGHAAKPKGPRQVYAFTVSASEILLFWNDKSKNETGFKIQRAPDNNGIPGAWSEIATVGANVTLFSNAGLPANAKFWYRVRAYNRRGESSRPVQATTITLPRPPNNLTAQAISTSQINLSWEPDLHGQNGFKIERSASSNGQVVAWRQIASVGSTATNFSDKNLASDTTYSYRVRAYNSSGNSAYSNIADGSTPPPCLLSVARWGSAPGDLPAGLTRVTAVAAGYFHSLALKSDGKIVGWGDNFYGQATPPTNLAGVVRIAAGNYHSLALKSDGTVVGWGNDVYGQATPPTNLASVVRIAAGYFHSLALKSDGGVIGWGDDSNGAATPPTNLTGVVAIAAGSFHGLALKSNGTVVGWGYDANGRATPPTNLTGVVAIAAGEAHGLALKNNGTVVGWGYDGDGRATPPTNLTGVVAIAAGTSHSLALKSDGTVVGWGTVYSGEVTPAGLTGRATAIAAGSEYSLALTFAPSPPSIGTAIIVSTNQIKLSWLDKSETEDGFRIQRALDTITNGPGIWAEIATVGANVTNYTNTGVVSNATYWYRVQATNSSCGDSPYGSTIAVSVTPPMAPYLYATPFGDRVWLTWYNNSSTIGIGGYQIERAPDDNGRPGTWTEIATIADANSTFYTDTGRALNARYWYRVRAVNGVGDSPYSNEADATILPPAAPNSLTALIGTTNHVDLSWYEYSGDQDGFKLERAPDVGGGPGTWLEIATLNITNISYSYYSDPGVAANQKYWYRVRAFNPLGDSPYSSPTTINIVSPPAPLPLYAYPFADNVNLSWDSYYGDYGTVDGFKIERAPDASGVPGAWAEITTVNGYQNYYSDLGRALDATYWYRVRAFNWMGDGDYTGAASATIVPPAAPYAPAASIGSTNQVNLSWSAPYPYDHDGFELLRAPDAGGSPGAWTEIATILATNTSSGEFTDTNAAAYTTNWYRVRAFNVLGLSTYSSPASIRVLPPPRPNSLSARAVADRVDLLWYGYYYDYGSVDGFKLERAPDNSGSPGTWTEITNVAGSVNYFTDMGRALNATYWYRVRAYNWIGDGPYSPTTAATIVPPNMPYSLTGRIGTTNQVNLSWYESPADEDGFRLERAPDAGGIAGAWTEIGTILATNNSYGYFADTNVTARTTNWYRVRAFNVLGISTYSDPTRVNAAPPPAPTSLSASAYRDQINLQWYAYYYDYGSVDGFKLERAPDAGGSPGTWAEITRITNNLYNSYFYFPDEGRLPNTTYWYRVRAYNWIGEGEYSPTASATIVPPAVPASVYARIGTTNHHVNVSWYDSAADEDGFKLERAPDVAGNPGAWAEIATILGTNASSGEFTDTNATAYTTNWYRVRAFNYIGHSDYSAPAGLPIVPPMAPASLYANAFRDQIHLTWYNNDAYLAGTLGTKIQRAPDASGQPGAWTTIATNYAPGSTYNNYPDSGLSPGARYWYRVLAFNWTGDSPYSDPAAATIVPPGVPYSLNANVGTSNRVDLYWYDSAEDEDGFRLERASDAGGNPGAWTEIATILATNSFYGQFTDTNVMANATNWYRVRAFNLVGISDYSDPANVAIVPPGMPLYLDAAAVASNRVSLNWYAYLGLIEGYKLERATNAGGVPETWVQVAKLAGQNNTSYNDNLVSLNSTYWYRVRAYNWIGDSPYSDLSRVSITTPTAPADLIVSNGWRNQIALAWVNTSTNADGFYVERAPDVNGSPGPWVQFASVGSYITSYADTGRVANLTYWYRVRAYNGVGASPYSNEASALVRAGQFVRVMQWNVEHGLGRPGNAFNFTAQSIARIVNYNQPDVLLFNEIDAQNLAPADIEGALIDWVTNSLAYLGTQPGTNFYVAVSSKTDGFNRNAAISRYPLLSPTTYDDGLRGLHSMQVQLSPANALQVFHAHLKCCADDCTRKQTEAAFDAGVIGAFAATNSLPYLFAGDWNEEEEKQPSVCALSGTYHPITTIRQGARLAEFKPTTLDGEYRTWSSQDNAPSIRFDYILPASNRLAAIGGYVFNSDAWANRGLYNGNYYDSYYASDHYCVFANYYFTDPGFIVSPANTFTSSGLQNGPFNPTSQSYTLSNPTSSPLTWIITNTPNWLTASPTGGTLEAGGMTSVRLSINASANALTSDNYEENVRFLNPSNGEALFVIARLGIQWSPLLTAAVTKPATGISAGGAVLNGLMSPGTNNTPAWFEWGTDTNYGNITATTPVAAGSTPPVALSNALSGLNADLIYHYRIVVSNVLGIVRGLDEAFQVGVLPAAITLAPTAVTTDGAMLPTSINPGGRSTTAWFQWGDTTAYGNSTPATLVGSGTATVSFVASIMGLSPVVYHYRAVASNSLGVTLGADMAFGRSIVDGNDMHQRIDGFGGGVQFLNPGSLDPVPNSVLDTLFLRTNANQLGLTILRIGIDPVSWNNNQLLDAQKAVVRGASILATPWTPPASMKDNASRIGGSLLPAQYTNYANYLNSFAGFMASNGAPLKALSIQNEPDISVSYDSCVWTPGQLQNFCRDVGGLITNASLMMPESFNFNSAISDPTLDDPAAAANVDYVGGHLYGVDTIVNYANALNKGKPVWMTEYLVNDQTIETAIITARQMHDCLTVGNMSAYIWWKTYGDANGLVSASGVPQKRGFVFAQWSRFVRPGYYRVGVANAGNVLVSSYQNPISGDFAIVAINASASPSMQVFKLANFASVSSVTPWITSASLSLANQPAITVSNASFVYTLPANSIVTFAGQATATPPTLLVTPLVDLNSTGLIGGPHTPASQIYTLNNSGNAAISWVASNSTSLISLSAGNGMLAAGESTNVVVSFSANANVLPTGTYSDSVNFINATDGNGNTTRAVNLVVFYPSAGLFGFYDDFGTFAGGNLVGVNGWTQALAASSLPLQIADGRLAIPFAQSTDNQDAYKNFTATNGTVFYGMTLIVSNAPSSGNPFYFAALYTGNNVSGFANYRIAARDNTGGTYVFGARITGQTGDPFTFASTSLTYGTQHRVIIEADSGGTVMSVFVDPTSSNLADQTAYLINTIGGGSPPPSVGSFVISQFGNGSVPGVGLTLGKVCVTDNFTNAYNFLTGVVPQPGLAALPVPDSATGLQITSVIRANYNVLITWQTIGGTTNVVQAASSLDAPFLNLSPNLAIPGSGYTTSSYLDAGALTNNSSRFYRIQRVP